MGHAHYYVKSMWLVRVKLDKHNKNTVYYNIVTGNRNHHGAYWFMLKKGVTQRCLCGGYFQLTEGPAAKVY